MAETTTATPQRMARESVGLSLRDLETATGINRGLLSWWERGKYNLTIEEVQRISEAIEAARDKAA